MQVNNSDAVAADDGRMSKKTRKTRGSSRFKELHSGRTRSECS
jgi:hypothetical protein